MGLDYSSNNLKVEGGSPALELHDTGGSGVDFKIRSNAGKVEVYNVDTGAVVAVLAPIVGDGWQAFTPVCSYGSADSPTFTMTVSGDYSSTLYPGMKMKLTQTGVKYFIITKVVYSAPNTTVYLYGGTDYTLTAAAISNVYYSMEKIPQGFPADPAKWTVTLSNSNTNGVAATTEVIYNPGSLYLDVPIGAWKLRQMFQVLVVYNTALSGTLYGGLSTLNNGFSDLSMISDEYLSAITAFQFVCNKEKFVNLASKTRYYVVARIDYGGGTATLYTNGGNTPIVVQAVCAYL